MSPSRARVAITTAALSASVLTPVAVGAVLAPAEAKICKVERVFVQSTTRGAPVWIPTSNHFSSPSNPSGWQEGGTQGYSESDGSQTAKTNGSAKGYDAGGGLSLGPVDVSGKYNQQWNKSTTTSNSVTKTWSEVIRLPKGKTSRMRIYQAGFRFAYKIAVVSTGGPSCKNRIINRTAVLPTKAKVTAMRVELYSNRNKPVPRGV